MAVNVYTIDEFYGIDQSRNANVLHQGTASDARNMDTSDGNLSVAKGFVKHIDVPIPGTGVVRRIVVFKNLVTTQYVAIAGDASGDMAVYAYTDTDAVPAWKTIYTYPSAVVGLRWDFMQVNIGNTDYLIIANGETQMIKWDGVAATAVAFGTAEKASDHKVNYIDMHYGRLFACGDPTNPNRLYWSQVPGDGATIEDWDADAVASSNSGGHVEIGDTRGDPIVGMVALATQILIFKRYSVYRIQGSNPDNFRIERIDAEVERMSHDSIAMHGDVAYYITPAGLYYFNNITVQPLPNARSIQKFMQDAKVELAKGAECKDKLYFGCYIGTNPSSRDYDNHLIEYDLHRGTYMVRDGFNIADMTSHDGILFLVNDARYVYRFNEGTSYDGTNINAYWTTQKTDLHQKWRDKKISATYLRGTGDALLFTVYFGSSYRTERRIVGAVDTVLEISPSTDMARTFAFKIANEAGSAFSLDGGMESEYTTNDGGRIR